MRDMEIYLECREFYTDEAALLDNWEIDDWLDLLTDDVRYVAPLRETKERRDRAEEFSAEAFHFRDDKESLEMRVQKANHEYSWAHLPPVRDRRFVSNIKVLDQQEDELQTRSNLLVRLSERDIPEDTGVITCERFDTLRRVDGSLKIADREIFFDNTNFDFPLMIFF